MFDAQSSADSHDDQPASELTLDGLMAYIEQRLDDVEMSPLQRLKLTRELGQIKKDMETAAGLPKLKLARRLGEIRTELGAAVKVTPTKEAEADAIAEGLAERTSTSKFFDFDEDRKPAQRKRDNAQAMALIARINEGTLDAAALTDEEKIALAKYSGTGGNLVGADGKKGSAYEYYTPKPIAEGMWSLLKELGFQGGKVLDPCGGVGIFGATAPVNAAVDAVELNATSGRVNQLVNDGPGYSTIIAPFEKVAAATPDETYDAVVSNVPFGNVNDRGGNQFLDEKYKGEPIQNYFILRSLEKLKPGGLAAFITPPRCVSGKGGKEESLRLRASYMAEFMGAYRLPNSVFGTAAADTMTDVMIFRKYSREVLTRIEELREQSPQTLIDARVIDADFINGVYFLNEGKKYILGDPVKVKNRFGDDVDALVTGLSMTDIAKLLRKFPRSNVNFELLNAVETSPIIYREGDTIRHAGNTLQMKDGRWVVIQPAGSEDAAAAMADNLARMTTPLGAINAGVAYGEAQALVDAMVDAAQALDIPGWIRALLAQLQNAPAEAREGAFNAAVCGLAIDQAMLERMAEETGFNYLEGYPMLSEVMKRVAADAKRPPAALAMSIKTAMKKVAIHYNKANGYSGVWRGDVAQSVDRRDAAAKFEAQRYQAGGGAFVKIEDARAALGEDFDPMTDDEWAVSPDGASVAKAADYYVGNYADFLVRINAEIEACNDPAVRDKLLRQKYQAEKRVVKTDPSTMSFTLFSPFVTLQERVQFLQQFVHKDFDVGFDNDGNPEIIFDGKIETERDKLLKRYALYLSGRYRLGLGGVDVTDSEAAIAALRTIANTSQAQFNAWVKSNPIITGRLADLANDPARCYFKQVDDDSPLTVPGLNPEWKSKGYQNAWVRQTGRDFSGINGFGVGLGKTSSALIAIQHAQSIGTKTRTMIVVPNSVLTNWKKEAARVYASVEDCLFVGMRANKKGAVVMDTKAYDEDLTKILEGRHSKVFVTYEAFQRLRLKEATAEAYDRYLASVDSTYADSDLTKEAEKGKSLRAQLINQLTNDKAKSAAAPYFEDLNIDSLVLDEAHWAKNSSRTIEFKGGKFLSTAPPSARGLDAQAKAWCVRKDAPRKDGVILLSATFITNSPLEVHSMLSLAVGHDKLNNLMVGIKGADDFMEVMCQLENRDEETLDGTVKPYDVFTGLNNVDVLRTAIQAVATVKEASDVGEQIVMPSSEEQPTPVALPAATLDLLKEYKGAFRFAIDNISGKQPNRGDPDAFERVAAKFGEPEELIGHPFNLIRKMSAVIADPELDQRATFYTISPAEADKAAALVTKWNLKAPNDERLRPSPHTDPSAIVGKKTVKDGDDKVEFLIIQQRAKVAENRVILDTMDAQVIFAFEEMAEKEGVNFDVSVPPKLAALIQNFQFEEANPRGKHMIDGQVIASGRVRQLIFCDNLAQHAKIKRLLVTRCGVSASSIAIVTGKINNRPEDILEIQDGFNAEGEDNKYRVVMSNETLEVGVNLQKGTQAIHHLTLGWTPDSLTQRNGRGARQGNETERVKIYHYDADGTFDTYKRMLVGRKADWIGAVLDPEGGSDVQVAGGLTRQQMEDLIDTVGDASAMSNKTAEIEARERMQRAKSTQDKQAIAVSTVKARREFIAKFPNAGSWAATKVGAYVQALLQAQIFQDRLSNPKATAGALVKNGNLLAEVNATAAGLKATIEESVLFQVDNKVSWQAGPPQIAPSTLDAFVKYMRTGSFYSDDKKLTSAERAAKFVTAGKDPYNKFKIITSEDGAIGNEWASEVDQAQSMIDASKDEFQRLARTEGGHSDQLLSGLEDGTTAVMDGKVVCEGAFVQHGDHLGYVYSDTTGYDAQRAKRILVRYIREDGKNTVVALADELRKNPVILPGSPGYDACVTRAAQLEDAIIEANTELASDAFENSFSAVIPAVAERRTRVANVRYGANDYSLPSPHFPRYVPAAKVPEGAEVMKAIIAAQAGIVAPSGFSISYFVASTAAGIVHEKPDTIGDLLIAYCKAHHVKASKADLDHCKSFDFRTDAQSMANGDAPKFDDAVLPGEATEEALKARMVAWLVNDYLPQYQVEADPVFQAGPALFLDKVNGNASWEYDRAVARIVRARKDAAAAAEKAAAAAAAGVTAPEPTPAPTVDLAADPGMEPNTPVMVIGNTMKWKDTLKEVSWANQSPPKWNKNGGPMANGKPSGCWSVTFKVWQVFLQQYPAAGQDLQLYKR